MNKMVFPCIAVLALLVGFATTASAQNQDKSWEVDVYDDGADVTYIDDGYDDIHVYDHTDHRNDRSYIAVDDYGYDYDYGYRSSSNYDRYYDRHYDDRRYYH